MIDPTFLIIGAIQVVNIMVSATAPLVSNFAQSISHSSCLGCCSIDRMVRRNQTMRPQKSNRRNAINIPKRPDVLANLNNSRNSF